MNPFVKLPRSNLESLKAGFAHGSLKYGLSRASLIQNGAPADLAAELEDYVSTKKLPGTFMITMLETILEARDHAHNVALSQSIVVTGPEIAGAENLKTGSRFLQIVEHAKRELMLATFALYRGDEILSPIHGAMNRNEALKVILVVNIPRRSGDTTVTSDLVEAFRRDFWSRQWPWQDRRPTVYYFPDSLHMEAKLRGSMHAKFLIADEERCFITSANFTEAARTRNIEIGVELSNSQEPKALSRYFKRLIERHYLHQLP